MKAYTRVQLITLGQKAAAWAGGCSIKALLRLEDVFTRDRCNYSIRLEDVAFGREYFHATTSLFISIKRSRLRYHRFIYLFISPFYLDACHASSESRTKSLEKSPIRKKNSRHVIRAFPLNYDNR